VKKINADAISVTREGGKNARNAEGQAGQERRGGHARAFAGRVTAISANVRGRGGEEGINETGVLRRRDAEHHRLRGEAALPERANAQIPHENSTIAHLPAVDTEHSRGALTYRVRHI